MALVRFLIEKFNGDPANTSSQDIKDFVESELDDDDRLLDANQRARIESAVLDGVKYTQAEKDKLADYKKVTEADNNKILKVANGKVITADENTGNPDALEQVSTGVTLLGDGRPTTSLEVAIPLTQAEKTKIDIIPNVSVQANGKICLLYTSPSPRD